LVDIVLWVLVLLGIERVNIVEHHTASTYYELEFIPYSHGLLSALVWAALAYGVARALTAGQGAQRKTVALVMAVAQFSHWVLDWIVHTPDLPVTVDGSAKVGLVCGTMHPSLSRLKLPCFWLACGCTCGERRRPRLQVRCAGAGRGDDRAERFQYLWASTWKRNAHGRDFAGHLLGVWRGGVLVG